MDVGPLFFNMYLISMITKYITEYILNFLSFELFVDMTAWMESVNSLIKYSLILINCHFWRGEKYYQFCVTVHNYDKNLTLHPLN